MKNALALLSIGMLAACGSSEPEPAPTPTPTVAAPRTLVGADLDLSTLGAKIVGPQGPEVRTVLSAGNREIGRLVSYVACPADTAECKPGEMPEGTVYTYVHRVTLADTEDGTQMAERDGPEVAEATLGDPDAISITNDSGSLIWRVSRGSGWKPGGTMTFWWQSTTPPQGPAEAYLLEVDGNQAIATGPFPAEEKPVEGARPR